MAQTPLPQFFTDVLTDEEVDVFYAKKELETLKDLCLAYNNLNTDNQIEIEEIQDDKIAMIIALWMREQYNIPETITWGPPYDKGFQQAVIGMINDDEMMFQEDHEDEVYKLPKAQKTIIYKVLTHPDQLLGFLSCLFRMTETVDKKKLKLLMESLGFKNITDISQLLKILSNFSQIALVYIALVGTYVTEMYIMGTQDLPDLKDYTKIYYPKKINVN